MNQGNAATGTLKAGTTISGLGSFTITPVLETAITNQTVALSDDGGNVYYENTGGTQKYNANDGNAIGTTYATAQVKFTIAYSGPLSTAAEILAAWNAAAGDDFVVTFADTTGYTSATPSAAIVTVAGTSGKKDGADYGLKVKTAAAPTREANGWKNAGSEGTKVNTLASSTFSLDDPGSFSTPSGSAGSYTSSVTSAVKATFYIGIVGIDGVAQTADDAYSCNFEVSGTNVTPRA